MIRLVKTCNGIRQQAILGRFSSLLTALPAVMPVRSVVEFRFATAQPPFSALFTSSLPLLTRNLYLPVSGLGRLLCQGYRGQGGFASQALPAQ
jgi:hypothetical protein